MSRETSLFVIVMAAGALGAIAHVLRSFYWYVGNRALRRSWLPMYLLLPLVGALFGLIVYLVVRGGLTSPAGGASDVNPYGIAAIAALVGQFSRETAEKFRAVFSTLLAPAPPGSDHAPGAADHRGRARGRPAGRAGHAPRHRAGVRDGRPFRGGAVARGGRDGHAGADRRPGRAPPRGAPW
ncbi:hypothetical protein LUX73_36075 [Actinomadura madurae]|nr:hypothetical protein [Actinomadura madurae]MCQ0009594.1 hypothetical protein [Actinomadura madurae]